jgi:hypothetical protein
MEGQGGSVGLEGRGSVIAGASVMALHKQANSLGGAITRREGPATPGAGDLYLTALPFDS